MTAPVRYGDIPPMSDQPIIVLGAGIAGLTTAYHLLKSRHDNGADALRGPVVLLEKEERAGGLASSISREGVITDLGPHRLHTELPEVKALLEEVASEHIVEVSRESHLYWRGQRLRYPISPFELLRKIGPVAMAGLSARALLAKVGIDGRKDDADSFENVMRAQFGAGLWDGMLGPYSEKVWRRPCGEVHGDVARVRVSAGGISKIAKRLLRFGREKEGEESALKVFRYPKGGLQTLVDILVGKVEELGGEIVCGAPLQSLETADAEDGRQRIVKVVAGPNGERTFDNPAAVVSTIPLPVLGGELSPEVDELTGALEYLSLLLCVLVIGRDRLTRDNWLYFFDNDVVVTRAYEAKNFDPSLAPEGRTALCCEVSCRADEEIWTGDRDALLDEVVRDVAGTGLFREDEVVGRFVHPLRHAYPIYSLDYRDRLLAIFERLALYENLLTTGRQGLFNHNNTDHSMSMGMAVAETLRQNPANPAAAWFDGVLDRFAHFRIVD